MAEQVKAIEEYYTNLEYNNDKEKALTKILALTEEIKFSEVNNFSDRFAKTVSIIKKNLSVFKAVCNHMDLVTTIIDYLNYYSITFALDSKYEEQCKKDDRVFFVILDSLLNIYVESNMRLFFISALVENSAHGKSHWMNRTSYTTELILLADSDLNAVITYLKRTFYKYINKIWVQQSIEQKFLWLVKEYLEDFDISIRIFRTKKELFTANISNKINFVSIWTEDIVFAKNLATSLNGKRDALFINTNIDFCNGIVLLPHTQMCYETLEKCPPSFFDLVKKPSSKLQKDLVYYLFYDGTWQPPVKGTYWIHDECQIANATNYDIIKCINSAEKGFNVWSSKSITNRRQILSKFVSTLNGSGKCVLANMISKWINFSYIYENSSLSSQNQGLEITTIRCPRGVIILKEEDEDEVILFCRLMQILTVGNSVIVISDTNFCSLVPYCNMFSASEIPPGVINLLSSDCIKDLELCLCGMNYASYAEQLFSEDIKEIFKKLTIPKQIVMPLK